MQLRSQAYLEGSVGTPGELTIQPRSKWPHIYGLYKQDALSKETQKMIVLIKSITLAMAINRADENFLSLIDCILHQGRRPDCENAPVVQPLTRPCFLLWSAVCASETECDLTL